MCQGQNTLRLKHKELVINSQTVCGNINGLTEEQRDMCSEDAHAVASALQVSTQGIPRP